MPDAIETLLYRIRALVSSSSNRERTAKELAEIIQNFGRYRWVGVYEVRSDRVSILAWSGPEAPAHPIFPITKGLTGSAIAQKATVVVGDVRKDPRYLTTFGNTLSEMIVPVVDAQTQKVLGTIDVESERADAFSAQDRQTLEMCAVSALPLWNDHFKC